MKISEMIEHLEYQKNTYGDNEVILSITGGETENGDKVLVQAFGDLNFTYFQVSQDQELLIIGDKNAGI